MESRGTAGAGCEKKGGSGAKSLSTARKMGPNEMWHGLPCRLDATGRYLEGNRIRGIKIGKTGGNLGN